MRDAFDLIVVGAGPAGSSCARRGAELGLSVLVLERATFPRAKPCAAGLTARALDLLGGSERLVAHRHLSIVELSFGDNLTLVWRAEEPAVVTTTRREFDSVLADQAMQAGARLEFGKDVRSIESADGSVRVTAGETEFVGEYVVAADGARSGVRRALGLNPLSMGGAMYIRATPESPDELGVHADRVVLDSTATRRGYAWIFPKSDHLNVGVFSQRPLDRSYQADLERFAARRRLAGWKREGPLAAPIPIGRPNDAFGAGRVLIAGDAAGLVDPVTGEGIPHAIRSGAAAAESIAEALSSSGNPLPVYRRRVETEIVPVVESLALPGSVVYGLGPRGTLAAARFAPTRWLITSLFRQRSRRSKRGLSLDEVKGPVASPSEGGDE